MKVITHNPLEIWRTGLTSNSETLEMLIKTFDDISDFFLFKKNSYDWDNYFFWASSDKSFQTATRSLSCAALRNNFENDASQFIAMYMTTRLITFVFGSSGMKCCNGKLGWLGWPIKTVNNLETIQTTITSTKPVKAAKGINFNRELLLLTGSAFSRRINRWYVLLVPIIL